MLAFITEAGIILCALSNQPPQFIVMGVSGCGKSTIARELAAASRGVYLDGDDYHPPENKAKMTSGTPLNDNDRAGWLEKLNELLREHAERGEQLFLACSALKEKYRDILRKDLDKLEFVHLAGDFDTIYDRMKQRSNHFMPPELLQSQFDALEDPTYALHLDTREPVDKLIEDCLERWPDLAKFH